MDDFVRVKDAVDLVDVVSRHVELKRAGARMVGCCPFHAEKTASFGIPIGQKYFKCFGCGKGGDVFTFLEEHLRISRAEALHQLAEEYGITLSAAPSAARGEKERALRVLADAQDLYRRAYASPIGDAARALVTTRRLVGDMVDAFGVGYAPIGPGGPFRSAVIAQRLVNAGHHREDIVAAGIANERDGDLTDFLRDRLTIPIRDERGRVIAFGGRRMRDGPGVDDPKYINSRETLVFSKSHVLFGLDRARPAILKAGQLVLVEGYMDVILSHQGGLDTAVAALGTSVTADHAKQLARLAPKAVLFLDSDEAGKRAAERAVPLLLAEKLDVRVLVLAADKDPGDFFARGATRAEFDTLLATDAQLGIEFLIARSGGGAARSIDDRIRIARRIGESFQRVADPLVRAAVVANLARALDLPASDLDLALGLRPGRRPWKSAASPAGGAAATAQEGASSDGKVPPEAPPAVSLPPAQVLAEEELLIALLRDPGLRGMASRLIPAATFGDPRRARLFETLIEETATEPSEPGGGGGIVELLLGKLVAEPEAQQTLMDLVSRLGSADPGKLFDGAVRWFEQRRRKQEGDEIRVRSRAALDAGDPTAAADFLRRYESFRKGGGAN